MKRVAFLFAVVLFSISSSAFAYIFPKAPSTPKAPKWVPAWHTHCLMARTIADTIQYEKQQGATIHKAYQSVVNLNNPNSNWHPNRLWEKRLVYTIYNYPNIDEIMRYPADRIGNSVAKGCRREHSIENIH